MGFVDTAHFYVTKEVDQLIKETEVNNLSQHFTKTQDLVVLFLFTTEFYLSVFSEELCPIWSSSSSLENYTLIVRLKLLAFVKTFL